MCDISLKRIIIIAANIKVVANHGVGILVVTIRLELCTYYSSSRHRQLRHLCSNKIQNGNILVTADPGRRGKWPLNECCHNS